MRDSTMDTLNIAGRRNETAGSEAVSFAAKMVASENFMLLFKEGMALVETTASYLDGDGRNDSRLLDRTTSLAYASESMRLTTRLMQLTSWLLLQRAVNEGELSRDDAEREHRRVAVSPQDSTSADELYQKLPEKLRDLIERSLRLQTRIRRLDDDLKSESLPPVPVENPVANQLGMLAAAFGKR